MKLIKEPLLTFTIEGFRVFSLQKNKRGVKSVCERERGDEDLSIKTQQNIIER